MINYHSSLVTALKTGASGVPVYFEVFDTKKEVPCISYFESNNIDTAIGTTMAYSEVEFQIRIWAKTIKEILEIAAKVDNSMKPLGFRRTFSTDLNDGDLCSKIIRYSALGIER